MKKTLLHITIASLLTLGSLIVLSIVWSLVLGSIESQFIRELSFGLLLPAIFAWILVYISKIRKETTADEMLEDYKEQKYTTFQNDCKVMLLRERGCLLAMAVICVACYFVNLLPQPFSSVALVFSPMYMLSTVIPVEFFGYLLGALHTCALYLLFVARDRRKQYKIWLQKH